MNYLSPLMEQHCLEYSYAPNCYLLYKLISKFWACSMCRCWLVIQSFKCRPYLMKMNNVMHMFVHCSNPPHCDHWWSNLSWCSIPTNCISLFLSVINCWRTASVMLLLQLILNWDSPSEGLRVNAVRINKLQVLLWKLKRLSEQDKNKNVWILSRTESTVLYWPK